MLNVEENTRSHYTKNRYESSSDKGLRVRPVGGSNKARPFESRKCLLMPSGRTPCATTSFLEIRLEKPTRKLYGKKEVLLEDSIRRKERRRKVVHRLWKERTQRNATD